MFRLGGLFACIGVAVCLFLIAAWKATAASQLWTISDAVTGLMLVLWPASFGLVAIHPASTTRDVFIVYAILIMINAVLYGVVGVAVASIIRLGRRSV